MNFEGKCCIVTGGARGIGRSTVEALLKRGAKCIVADILWKEGEETANELSAKFGPDNVAFRRVDVASANNFQDVFDFCVDSLGSVDIVVNNAGINGENNWESMLDINHKGTVTGTTLGLRYMGKNGKANPGGRRSGGIVVNVSSIQGLICFPAMPVYSSGKAAIVAFCRCQGHPVNYALHGVRVVAFCPYGVVTPIEDYLDYIGMSAEGAAFLKTLDVVDRQLSADEVGEGIVKVISEAESGSVWYHHKSGDDPIEVEDHGTWENVLKNLPKE